MLKRSPIELAYDDLIIPFTLRIIFETAVSEWKPSRKLCDIAEIKTGKTPSKRNDSFYHGTYPFFKPGDLNTGYYVNESKDRLSQLGRQHARIAPAKSILVTCIGATIGKVGFTRIEGAFNQQINAIVPNNDIIPEYIYFMMLSPQIQQKIIEKSSTTTLPILNKSKFKEINIPVPDIKTQKQIVQFLDEINLREDSTLNENLLPSSFQGIIETIERFRLIAIKTKQSSWNLGVRVPILTKRLRMAILSKCFMGELTERNPEDEHARSLLEKMKSEQTELVQRQSKKNRTVNLDEMPELPEKWIWTTIGEIGNFIGSGITPRGGRKVYVEKGVPFIRSQNVYPDGLRTDNIVFVTSEMNEKMSRTKVQSHDILLNITGASIGRSTFVPENFGPANVNQHVCIIRTSESIHPAYLSWFLNSSYGQNQIMSSQSGVTREGLNYSQVRNIRFPLAPLGEQSQIVKLVGTIVENSLLLGRAVEDSLDKLQLLEQSILRVAFSGKLVHANGMEQ